MLKEDFDVDVFLESFLFFQSSHFAKRIKTFFRSLDALVVFDKEALLSSLSQPITYRSSKE